MTHSINLTPAIPRALVVYNDTSQLNVLCGLLKNAGMEPINFKSAETALAALGQYEPPALIITDLYMPGIDGWRFCRLLRYPEYAQFNQIPILVLSATFSGDEPSRITSELGANAFMPMPVDGKQFIETVQAILRGEKPQGLLRVLIVEDSQLVSNRLVKAFQAHGYQADETASFQDAFAMIERTAYDAAVLDYHLPDGSGDGLLEALGEKSPDCVCVMMAADPQPELALNWVKMGAAAYLQKPFEPEYLIFQCERARHERTLLRIQDLLELRTRQLRESEEKYRRVSEDMPALISAFLPDGTLTYVNQALANLAGATPDELTGHCFFDMLPQEERTTIEGKLASLCAEQPFETHEQTHTAQDGSSYVIQWTNHAFYDKSGQAVSFQAIGVDITERKQAEELLRESEEKYKSLHESAGVGIGYYSLDGKVISYNRMAARHMGGNPEEFSGKSVYELFPSSDADVYMDRIRKASTSNEIQEYEDKVELPGGVKWFFSAFTRILNSFNLVIGVQIISSDISKNKQAEDALKEDRQRLDSIIKGTNTGTWEWNAQTGKMIFNDRWAEVIGYSLDEISPVSIETWMNYAHPDDLKVRGELLERHFRGELDYYEFESRMKHKDGNWVWVLDRGKVTSWTGDGKPLMMMGTQQDITERKQAEEALHQKIDELLRFQRLTVGRELRMIELKKEINTLLKQAGKPEKYRIGDVQ